MLSRVAKRPAKKEKSDTPVERRGERKIGPECRVLLLVGEDAFLRLGYTDQLRKAIEEAGESTQITRFDGGSSSPADVLDECRSMGLLAGYKIVVVDDAHEFVTSGARGGDAGADESEEPASRDSSRRAMLERYVQAPCEGVTLVLRAPSWRKGNLDKMIEAVGRIVPCDRLTPERAALWTTQRCLRTHQREIDPSAAELLVRALNADLASIDAELLRLSAAVDAGARITTKDVERFVRPVLEAEDAWRFGDHLLSGSARAGVEKLHEMIDQRGVDPVPLRAACISVASKLHAVSREIERGVPLAATGKGLKMFWGPQAEAIRRVAASAHPDACAALLQHCLDADFKGKTGREDPVRGLEWCVIQFANLVRLSAARPRVR